MGFVAVLALMVLADAIIFRSYSHSLAVGGDWHTAMGRSVIGIFGIGMLGVLAIVVLFEIRLHFKYRPVHGRHHEYYQRTAAALPFWLRLPWER